MKVDILFRPDKEDERQMADKIAEMVKSAAATIKKEVTINKTSNFREFSDLSVNVSITPIVIIDGISEFAGSLPSQDQIKQKLLAGGGANEIF